MEDWDINTILLGYDGSEGAERAAVLAADVARCRQAQVVVLTAFHIGSDIYSSDTARKIAEAEDRAEGMVAKLRDSGIEATPDVLQSPAGEALVTAAETRHADLIVLGSRGVSPLGALLLGSVSEYVVRRAHVSVLIAR